MEPKYQINQVVNTVGYDEIKIIDILKSETRFCYLIENVDDSCQQYLIFEEELLP